MPLPFRLLGGLAMLLAGCPGAVAAESQLPAETAMGRLPLLAAAFDAFLASQGRWAYIETHAIVGSGGQRRSESILRIDPSQPYAQQIVPLKVDGQPPTQKQIKDWAAHNEEIARRRGENAVPKAGSEDEGQFRLHVGNRDVTPLLDHASVVAEDTTTVTYLVPLRLAGRTGAPLFDTYRLTARVNKLLRQFEHVTLQQQKPYKIAAWTCSDGLIEVDFERPDARFPATPGRTMVLQTKKPLFGQPHQMHEVIERTDFRRVTPYDERFGVKIGQLRILEF